MNKQEAIDKLNKIGSGDKESDHIYADEILLECVDPEIKQAYERAKHSAGGFWYA